MRVLVVEDHPIYFEGFRTILRKLDPVVETVSAPTAETALSRCETNADFDLGIVDLTLPGMDGVTFIESLVARQIWFPIIVISAEEDLDRISRAMSAGALGFIPKSMDMSLTLVAIRGVLDGHIFLPDRVKQQMQRMRRANGAETHDAAASFGITPRQYRVLQLLADGLSNAQIATALNVTEHTVKSHVRALFLALDADSRTACVHTAAKKGLVRMTSTAAGGQPVDHHP